VLISVETAEQMHRAVLELYPKSDIVIKAAAVADYRPRVEFAQKIKKKESFLTLELEKTPDILLELGKLKQHQILVGFAAETEKLLEHAREKILKKNLDLLVANDVTLSGAGFGSDTNIASILYSDGRTENLPQMDKSELSCIIWDRIVALNTGEH